MPNDRQTKINNEIYNDRQMSWWEPDSPLYLLYSSVNPLRTRFSRTQLFDRLHLEPKTLKALDVGCGAGLLSEEIVQMGFETHGIDTAEAAINLAREHAAKKKLDINYKVAPGETLPYPDAHFDVVFCCDVLEHVDDFEKVIAEIARVLKPGGIFIYDTINRTFFSNIAAIKIAQEWAPFAFMPPRLHVHAMFIKPFEMKAALHKNNFTIVAQSGAQANINPLKLLWYLWRRKKGKMSFKELGEKFKLVENPNTSIFYIGCAVKQAAHS